VDRTVSALRKGFANRLPCSIGTGAKYHNLATVFFFQEQSLFQRIRAGLIDFEA